MQQKLGEAHRDRARRGAPALPGEPDEPVDDHRARGPARHIAAVEASGPGFGRSVREAGYDAAYVGIAIVNGAIRLFGVLLPVGVLIGVPVYLLVRVWRRRRAKA